MKKGSIWVSAILYIALGIIVITLILSAGIPLINKMKDQNTFSQTKNLMYTLDENIRTVVNEGPGSKRYLSPIEINEGELDIDETTDEIIWKKTTTNLLFELNPLGTLDEDKLKFEEGNLIMWIDETQIEEEYELTLQLLFDSIADLEVSSASGSPFKGKYSLSIYHTGDYNEDNTPKILLELI